MKYANYMVLTIIMFCTGCSITTLKLQDIDKAVISDFGSRPQTLADVNDALIRAGDTKGWVIKDVEPGHAIGRIDIRGKHHVTIDITYSIKVISIRYVDSRNMDFELRDNQKFIHLNYNKWISDLLRTLRRELAQL